MSGRSRTERCRQADEVRVLRRRLPAMRPDQLERRLRERLEVLGPAPRAELLHVLMLPDAPDLRATNVG